MKKLWSISNQIKQTDLIVTQNQIPIEVTSQSLQSLVEQPVEGTVLTLFIGKAVK